jgi:DNA-binding transcriptional ArsR family regulator
MKQVSESGVDQLSAVFAALADPTRRAILARLARGEVNVAELAAPFAISQPAISRHLKVLESAGLVTRTRRATARLSRLRAEPLRIATDWLADYQQYWEESFDQLEALLAGLSDDSQPESDSMAQPNPHAHERPQKSRTRSKKSQPDGEE